MADSSVAPKLLLADGQDALSQAWPIAGDGLDLVLRIEEGRELDLATSLRLLPVGDGGNIEEETLSAVVSCDLGTFDSAKKVAWLSADWGMERPLSSVHVQTDQAGKARLRIFTGGVWVPLAPLDIIATGSEQRFSPVMAGKLRVELVEEFSQDGKKLPGVWNPAPASVTGLVLKAALLPSGLSLAIAGQPAFFRWTGLLPIAGIPADGFAAAVNASLSKPDAARPVPLKLNASASGKLKLGFTPATVHVAKKLDKPVDGQLRLAWQAGGGAAATGRVDLAKGAKLGSLAFTAEPELTPSRVLGALGVGPIDKFQRCAKNQGLAQSFSLEEAPVLLGLDLPLRLRGEQLDATLALHPDQNGRPGPKPYGGAVLPIAWPADSLDEQ